MGTVVVLAILAGVVALIVRKMIKTKEWKIHSVRWRLQPLWRSLWTLREQASYQTTKMQREIILTKLKEKGCRITKQRLRLIDIILQNECSSCKEIFYRALEEDDKLESQPYTAWSTC